MHLFVTWMLSVTYYRLLNKFTAGRALNVLVEHLNQADRYDRLQGLVEEFQTEKIKLTLPGFNLLHSLGNHRTLQILLKKPNCSVAEFQGAYNAFVQKASVNEGTPGQSVCGIYRSGSEGNISLRRFRKRDNWYSVGLLMGLLSQTLGGEASYVNGELSVWFGTGQIKVSKAGCWNNDIYCYEPLDGGDFRTPATLFPSTITYDPVLKAVYTLVASEDVRNAVTLLAILVNEGHASLSDVRRAFVGSEGLLGIARLGKSRGVELVDEAYETCCTLLANPDKELVSRLARAAVPCLMTFDEFQSAFGAPSQVAENRTFRPATLGRWRDRITKRYKEVRSNANA